MTVSRRVVFGGPHRFGKQWRFRPREETLQTACTERWYGTLRELVAPRRRRTRCLSWSHAHCRGQVWLMVSLFNVVRTHKSLRQGRTPCPPAMAIGLAEHAWGYREYVWLPVHTDSGLTKQMDVRIARLLPTSPGLTHLAGHKHLLHAETLEENEKEAAPRPRAA